MYQRAFGEARRGSCHARETCCLRLLWRRHEAGAKCAARSGLSNGARHISCVMLPGLHLVGVLVESFFNGELDVRAYVGSVWGTSSLTDITSACRARFISAASRPCACF